MLLVMSPYILGHGKILSFQTHVKEKKVFNTSGLNLAKINCAMFFQNSELIFL